MKMNPRSASQVCSSLLAAIISLVIAGCASNSSDPLAAIKAAQARNAGNFTTTVFLGDSLTAGYQSGSLLDTQQVHGWAPLVATQASFNITLPLIAPPGAPNVLQLVSIGPPPVITTATGTTTGRDNFAAQPTNLAVPGAFVNDVANTIPLVNPAPGQQQINQLVLGFPGLGYGQDYSQATFAVKAQPTTIFLWAGNNDALIADLAGTPAAMTTVANFTTQYTALILELTTQTSAHLVIGNIPDVTLVPYLQPAASVLAQYSAATHLPVATLSALFGITTGDFVTPAGLTQISAILAGTQKTPISDPGVLTAAEVVTVKAQVTAFNAVIAQQAQTAGATLVDINALFNQVASSGVRRPAMATQPHSPRHQRSRNDDASQRRPQRRRHHAGNLGTEALTRRSTFRSPCAAQRDSPPNPSCTQTRHNHLGQAYAEQSPFLLPPRPC